MYGAEPEVTVVMLMRAWVLERRTPSLSWRPRLSKCGPFAFH